MTGKATRLYPLPARDIPAETIYEDLELPPEGWRDRSLPYVIINMVASVDGKAARAGKASSLGSTTDRRTMRNLRSKADAVMVGANTLRAERLSLGLDEPARGKQPLAVIVTASGDVPLESNLVLGEGQQLLLITPPDASAWSPERVPQEGAIPTLVVPAHKAGNVDLQLALELLRAEYDVNLLLVEGGPALNHALISSSLVHELFLTLAPRLIGGPSGGILLEPPLQDPPPLNLLSAHLAHDELFLRYRVGR